MGFRRKLKIEEAPAKYPDRQVGDLSVPAYKTGLARSTRIPQPAGRVFRSCPAVAFWRQKIQSTQTCRLGVALRQEGKVYRLTDGAGPHPARGAWCGINILKHPNTLHP